MKHIGRIAIAICASLVCLIVLMALLRVSYLFRQITLFVLPISVGVGVLPLIRWYGRDAYPIGLGYCLVMFFVLRFIGEQMRPLLWE